MELNIAEVAVLKGAVDKSAGLKSRASEITFPESAAFKNPAFDESFSGLNGLENLLCEFFLVIEAFRH